MVWLSGLTATSVANPIPIGLPTSEFDAVSMTDSVWSPELITYARRPSGLTVTASGKEPTVIGGAASVIVPVSMTLTTLYGVFAMYADDAASAPTIGRKQSPTTHAAAIAALDLRHSGILISNPCFGLPSRHRPGQLKRK